VNLASRVIQAGVSLAPLVDPDSLAVMVCLDTKDLRVTLVCPDCLVTPQKVQFAPLERLDPRVTLDLLVSQDVLDFLVFPDRRESLVAAVSHVSRERRVRREPQVWTDYQDYRVIEATLDLLDLPALMVTMVSLALLAQVDDRDLLVCLVCLDLLDLRVNLLLENSFKDPRETLVSQDWTDYQVSRDLQDLQDQVASQDSMDSVEIKETQDCQD